LYEPRLRIQDQPDQTLETDRSQPGRTQCIDASAAFFAITQGKGTRHDRETMAGVANSVMVLAEKHCEAVDLEAAQAAQMACLRADARAMQGKAWNFDGEGRTAMLAAIELFEDMVKHIGQGAVTEALVTVLERAAQGRVHRIELNGEAA